MTKKLAHGSGERELLGCAGGDQAVVEEAQGWGLFDIAGEVTCADGGFDYTSSGAWDGNGFHAAGNIVDGSGSGRFEMSQVAWLS